MNLAMDLTDEQWALIESLLPTSPPHEAGRGRPPCSHRSVLNGIFWVMRTGAPWRSLPHRYPSRHVCSRHFREWRRKGVIATILRELAGDLEYQTGIRSSDPTLAVPQSARDRATWWWQTVLLLRSPDAVALLKQ